MFAIIKLLGEVFTLAVFFAATPEPRRAGDHRPGSAGSRGW